LNTTNIEKTIFNVAICLWQIANWVGSLFYTTF